MASFAFVCFVLLWYILSNSVEGGQKPREEEDEFNKHLWISNKPSIMTMKKTHIIYADILKGATPEHTLQSETEGRYKVKYTQKMHNQNLSTLADESNLSFNLYANEDNNKFAYHWATLKTYSGRYTSAKVTINVYALPQVKANQASAAFISVINYGGGSASKNIITAGWQVYPELYGDYETHFFVHWKVVDKNIGCYNEICKGFILQKGSTYVPGSKIKPLSTYNGEQRYITMKISKDPQSGDWWLYHGPNGNESIGYWPKSLFTSLANSATNVEYGGVVYFHKYDKSPVMGSGHFPDEGEGKAASLMNIELDNFPYHPYDRTFSMYQSQPDCYKIDGDETLYFGGPGGCLE